MNSVNKFQTFINKSLSLGQNSVTLVKQKTVKVREKSEIYA